jgi:hypothetical protein
MHFLQEPCTDSSVCSSQSDNSDNITDRSDNHTETVACTSNPNLSIRVGTLSRREGTLPRGDQNSLSSGSLRRAGNNSNSGTLGRYAGGSQRRDVVYLG